MLDYSDWPGINFRRKEFECKCGNKGCELLPQTQTSKERLYAFIRWLDKVRAVFGKAMIVSSGYRCALHPIESKKYWPGIHNEGTAADIVISGAGALELLQVVLNNREGWWLSVGINQKGDYRKRFIHLAHVPPHRKKLIPAPHIYSY